MRFMTYADAHGSHAGVLSNDSIYGLPADVSLRGLLGDDGEQLQSAGEQAIRDPREVVALDHAHLLAPIPNPPTVRDFMTFESHYAGALLAIDPETLVPPAWYEAPAFISQIPTPCVVHLTTFRCRPGVRASTWNLRWPPSLDAVAETSTCKTLRTTSLGTACSTTGRRATCRSRK